MSRYKTYDDNGIYFTTHTIIEWMPVFKEKKYFDIIIDSLKYCQKKKGLVIFGYVIMINHFHLLAQTENNNKFQDVMRDMKKFTSISISNELEKDGANFLLDIFKEAAVNEKRKRSYKVWQNGYHPQIIYTDRVCRQKLEYMHHNPVKKGFVLKPEYWLYSSARNYIIGDDSIIDVELLTML